MRRDPPSGVGFPAFPATRLSVLGALRSGDPQAIARSLHRLAEAYHRPAYKYLRVRWRRTPEDAEDLVQDFFAAAFERGWLERYEPTRARFRTFLRVCLDRQVQDHDKAQKRQKRGGGATALSLDFEGLEGELSADGPIATEDPDLYFEAEFKRGLFAAAVDGLRAECEAAGKRRHYEVFSRYELREDDQPVSYASVAEELGISVHDVTNSLSFARRAFRRIVLEVLRELTSDEDDFRAEARGLLGLEL